MAGIRVHGVSVTFRTGLTAHTALRDVTLQVADGEFVSIVGPSGCGKTTLLNLIAGLLRPDGGTLEVDGRPITGPGPDRAVVFQEAALLPWRTVLRNVELGLELQRRYPRAEVRERARHFVRLVGLGDFAGHYPHQLSGGMRQRVNLARALVAEPVVLLMDEPFASLDAYTREAMGYELLRIWQETRTTVIFVTHSPDEAILLSDRIVAMGTAPGRIIEEIAVDVPRPRSEKIRALPRFAELGLILRQLLARGLGRA